MFEAFGRVISCSLVRDVSNPETHTVSNLVLDLC